MLLINNLKLYCKCAMSFPAQSSGIYLEGAYFASCKNVLTYDWKMFALEALNLLAAY